MRIILSAAWTDDNGVEHAGGDTIEVDDHTGLVSEATPAPPVPVQSPTSATATPSTASSGDDDESAQPKSPDEGETSEGVS